MSKVYRLEVETLWVHPVLNQSKRYEMVYDFTDNTLVPDERTHAHGQEFHEPEVSPHIYADWDKAELAYTNLDWLMDEWGPFEGSLAEGSNQYLEAFRLISVDENGNEEVEAENNHLELLIELNKVAKELAAAN